MGYVVAKYIRLSIEDAKTESLSVENQRYQLNQYLAGFDVADIEVREFVDNGFTGTNMDRPAFQSLIEQVEKGLVDCIVVKDFSRFGRDLVDVGYYIERVFPLFRVRFISLGDNYDSAQCKNGAGGEDMVFRLLVNEFYSRDLSQKIRAAKQSKTANGLFVTKNCAYGYKLDAGRKMVVDPIAADIVRRIFNMRLQGHKPKQIARALYTDGIPTPGVYKGHKSKKSQNPAFACVWESSVIHGILHDEQYTGTYVAGKSTILGVGGKTVRRKDESEWVKIPDHHPAIISRADFDAVQQTYSCRGKPQDKSKGQKKTAPRPAPVLKGKVYCGHCGRAMRPDGRMERGFLCGFSKHAPNLPCHGLSIRESKLNAAVYQLVLARLDKAVEADTAPHQPLVGGAGAQDSPMRLYERFLTGEIDTAAYKSLLAGPGAAKRRVQAMPGAMDLPGLKPMQTVDLPRLVKIANESTVLTRELVDAMVDKVFVHPHGEIEIRWKAELPGEREGLEDAG